MPFTIEQVEEAYNRHEAWIARQPNVSTTGYGVGVHTPLSIWVYGDDISPETEAKIRERVGEIPVDFFPTLPPAQLY